MNKRQWKKYKKKRSKAFAEMIFSPRMRLATGEMAVFLMEKLFPSFEEKTYVDKF